MIDGHCRCCGKDYDSLGFARDLCAHCDDPMHECGEDDTCELVCVKQGGDHYKTCPNR